MKFFYDFEFLEDGKTILPISIGIKAEDGRSYYAVNSDIQTNADHHDRIRRNEWLMKNVVPFLPVTRAVDWNSRAFQLDMASLSVKPLWVIRNEVLAFLFGGEQEHDDPVELWGEYSAYDHVLLAQLWGRMIDLPAGVPMHTNDVIQLFNSLGLDPDEVPMDGMSHVAIDDAAHVEAMYHYAMDKKTLGEIERDMAKWDEGHAEAVRGRQIPEGATDAEKELIARNYTILVAGLLRHLGGKLVLTRKDLIAAGLATLVVTNVGNGAMEVAVFHMNQEGDVGIFQRRQSGVRLPEQASGVPSPEEEGPEQGTGGEDLERGPHEGGAVEDGKESGTDPQA